MRTGPVGFLESRTAHVLAFVETSTQFAPCAEYELLTHEVGSLFVLICTNMPYLNLAGEPGDQL